MIIDLKYKFWLRLGIMTFNLLGIGFCIYFILQSDYNLRIYGAGLDETTSNVIMGLVGIGLFYGLITNVFNLLAGLKIKDDFYVHFNEDRFTFPSRKTFGKFTYLAYKYDRISGVGLYQTKWSGGIQLSFYEGGIINIELSNFVKNQNQLLEIQDELLKRIKS